jgi:hypothetical protein
VRRWRRWMKRKKRKNKRRRRRLEAVRPKWCKLDRRMTSKSKYM